MYRVQAFSPKTEDSFHILWQTADWKKKCDG